MVKPYPWVRPTAATATLSMRGSSSTRPSSARWSGRPAPAQDAERPGRCRGHRADRSGVDGEVGDSEIMVGNPDDPLAVRAGELRAVCHRQPGKAGPRRLQGRLKSSPRLKQLAVRGRCVAELKAKEALLRQPPDYLNVDTDGDTWLCYRHQAHVTRTTPADLELFAGSR